MGGNSRRGAADGDGISEYLAVCARTFRRGGASPPSRDGRSALLPPPLTACNVQLAAKHRAGTSSSCGPVLPPPFHVRLATFLAPLLILGRPRWCCFLIPSRSSSTGDRLLGSPARPRLLPAPSPAPLRPRADGHSGVAPGHDDWQCPAGLPASPSCLFDWSFVRRSRLVPTWRCQLAGLFVGRPWWRPGTVEGGPLSRG